MTGTFAAQVPETSRRALDRPERFANTRFLDVVPAKAGTHTPRPLDSIIGVSGILDHPLSGMMTDRIKFSNSQDRHCEPTGRANARPMTGSAKQSSFARRKLDCFVASAPRNDVET
jgi:hypothetical protein